jgi:hypothetical protein
MWDNRLWLRIGVDRGLSVKRGCYRVRLKMVAAGVGLIRMQEEVFWDYYAWLRIGVDVDMNG